MPTMRRRLGRPRRLTTTSLVVFAVTTATLMTGATTAKALAVAPRAHATSKAANHLDPGLPTTGAAGQRVVISAVAGARPAAERATQAVGGHVGVRLDMVNGFAATVPARSLPTLATNAAVLAITADRAAKLDSLVTPNLAGLLSSDSPFVKSTGADKVWGAGDNGAGVGVAVLDPGVSDVNDLSGRVIHGPDLSGEGTSVDTFGHGTVMAGIIGGDGTDSATSITPWRRGPRDGADVVKGSYTGVAPGVNVVAVKVAGRNASVDVSTMLQAM